MTDNVTITSGANSTAPAGTVVATDEISGAHYQIIKLAIGADGAATLLDIGQQADAASLPVVEAVPGAFDHGSKSAIGTSAAQLSAGSVPATRGVLVKAANGNSGTLYIGNSDVTAATVDATDGFELGAGEALLVRVNDVSKIYAIGSTTGLRAFWVVV